MSRPSQSPLHWCTPLIESAPLSNKRDRPVWLKMEAWQPTGSFKIRGLGHMAQVAAANGSKRLLSSSGGNAGLAVAYAGRRLGLPVQVIVPETTPQTTVAALQREGAEVTVHGAAWDDAHQHATALSGADSSTTYIHPFDHPHIWHGHASMAHELAEQCRNPPGAVIVAVGGGGLFCGLLQGMHQVGWTDIPVLAVETDGADCLARSVAAASPVRLNMIDSLATSLGAKTPCAQALAWTARHPVTNCIVTDQDAVAACSAFLDDHRCLVEPACGAALSLVYTRQDLLPDVDSFLVIVCGGAGTNLDLLHTWQTKTAAPKP